MKVPCLVIGDPTYDSTRMRSTKKILPFKLKFKLIQGLRPKSFLLRRIQSALFEITQDAQPLSTRTVVQIQICVKYHTSIVRIVRAPKFVRVQEILGMAPVQESIHKQRIAEFGADLNDPRDYTLTIGC
jgi:hypothetical protein